MTRYGLMLPHFGSLASYDRVIAGASSYERWGFDSVWVRDHLTFQPHGFEPPSTTFFEPFTTLAAIAARTKQLTLGTAIVVPWRHPLAVSQLFGGLRTVAGPGRLIAGLGAGSNRVPFDAAGLDFARRVEALTDLARVLRLTWSQPTASYHGALTDFDNITINPHPEPDTPIWIGGSSPAAVRRALALGDGWLPGRCPLGSFARWARQLTSAAAEQERGFSVGLMPAVSIGPSRGVAAEQVDVAGLLAEMRARRPAYAEEFRSVADLAGVLIHGSPADCAEQIAGLIEAGADHLIFDFRLRLHDFDEHLAAFAEQILPLLPREPAPAPGARPAVTGPAR